MTKRTRIPKGIYSIADLARREGISPKTARGRLRKYFGGTLPDLGISDWTYGLEDKEFVLGIISPSRWQAKNPAKMNLVVQPTQVKATIPTKPMAFPDAHRPATAYDADFIRMAPLHLVREVRAMKYMLPAERGLYAMFFDSPPGIAPTDGAFVRNGLHLLYIGTAGGDLSKNGNLRSRVGNNHLAGNERQSTFAQTLASLLPELAGPVFERLEGAKRMRKWHTSKDGQSELRQWMDDHVSICWTTCSNPLELERILLATYSPPLNLEDCTHPFGDKLSRLRKDRRDNAVPEI